MELICAKPQDASSDHSHRNTTIDLLATASVEIFTPPPGLFRIRPLADLPVNLPSQYSDPDPYQSTTSRPGRMVYNGL